MRQISYQQKVIFRKILKFLLLILAAFLLFFVLRFIYLSRYIVYDENGAHLEYGITASTEISAKPPSETYAYPIIRERSQSAREAAGRHFNGLYLTAPQTADESALRRASDAFGHSSALMLTVKGTTGTFLYPSALDLSERADAFLQLHRILEMAKQEKLYLIAALPAFADRDYALSDYRHSLQIKGGALWMNADGSYVLDPASEDTCGYLLAEVRELKDLGFDEVVFLDFDFPESDYLVYDEDGKTLTAALAQKLAESIASEEIDVSFVSEDEAILDISAHRYLFQTENENGEETPVKVAPDPENLVLVTDRLPDERTEYSVLQRLSQN